MDETELFWASYLGVGLICTLVEFLRPARKVRYGKALPLDVVACVLFQFVMFPAAAWLTDPAGAYVRHVPRPGPGRLAPVRSRVIPCCS